MNLEKKYPKLFEKLDDKDIELRHLLNIDENEFDIDSEEFDFDPDDYNYLIYIAEPIQNILGEEKLDELMVKLHEKDAFEYFLATEKDLYGVKTTLGEDEITFLVLNQVEEIV